MVTRITPLCMKCGNCVEVASRQAVRQARMIILQAYRKAKRSELTRKASEIICGLWLELENGRVNKLSHRSQVIPADKHFLDV